MPHLSFSTPVNGFYEDAMKKDPRSRVVLYAKISSNSQRDISNVNKKNVATLGKGDYKNDFYPIGITSLDSPLAIATQYDWQAGGNVVEHFMNKVREGIHDTYSTVTNILKTLDDVIDEIKNDGIIDDAAMNQLLRKGYRKIYTATDAYKRYAGSNTTINIPALEFTFPAEDFEGTHLNRAFALLSYLLPIVGTDVDKEGVVDKSVRNKSWMYEEAPNGYVSPFSGFDTSLIEGTFAIDFGGNVVKELIPVSVSLTQSKTKVLSEYDYYYKANNLLSYLGTEFKTWHRNKKGEVEIDNKNAHPAKLFYERIKLGYDGITKCQSSVQIPSVIRISVSFDFAKKVTPKDYVETFFTFDKYKLQIPDELANPNIKKITNGLPQTLVGGGNMMTSNAKTDIGGSITIKKEKSGINKQI